MPLAKFYYFRRFDLLLLALVLLGSAGVTTAQAQPQADIPVTVHDFGQVREDMALNHTFIIRNLGNQELKILADDGYKGDYFGGSVAISGEYMIVNTHCDDDNGTNSGAAYIYHKNTFEVSTASFLDDYAKEYLVFQVAKDPFINNLTTKADLEGKIKFEVYGLEQDISENLEIVKLWWKLTRENCNIYPIIIQLLTHSQRASRTTLNRTNQSKNHQRQIDIPTFPFPTSWRFFIVR